MIILFGAPGAGKTVQGQLLARKYNWRWVSSRELILNLNNRDATRALNCGMYIDEDVMAQAMTDAFSRGVGRRMILDGIPNTVQQLYWMRDHDLMKDVEGAITIHVPRGELWMRVSKRGRVDDTRAAFERRSDLYDRAAGGMLHVLKENGVRIATVDGRNEPEDVLARIEEVLGSWDIIERKKFQK